MEEQVPPSSQPSDPSQSIQPHEPSQSPEPSVPPQPPVTPIPPPPSTPPQPASPFSNTADPINTPSQPVTGVPSQTSGVPPVTPPPPAQQRGSRMQWLIILIIIFVGFLVVAAWYFQTQLQKSTQTMGKPTPSVSVSTSLPSTLIIGTDPTFPPMEYIKNGKMVGYDIDMANLIAKQMGVKVQFKDIVFDNLFTELDAKQINLIIAAVTITSERQQKYDFSIPYINAGEVIITQKTNNAITDTAELKGKKIGVQKDTTDEQEAVKFTPTNDVMLYATFVQATQALVAGQIDAIVTDLPDAQGIVSSNPTLKISSDPFTNEYYGIAFRKGDPNRARINAALQSLQERGYLTDLKHKWLY
jgi:ABC-type amino acid transport substrate-binding protein